MIKALGLLPALLIGPILWMERAPLPLPRAGYMAGMLGQDLMVAGGSYWQGGRKYWTDRVDIFNPRSNTWRTGPRLPEPRSDGAEATTLSRFYTLGGVANGRATSDVLALQNGRWKRIPSAALPTPLMNGVAVTYKNTVYLCGGLSDASDYQSATRALWSLNLDHPELGWRDLPQCPGPPRLTHAMAQFLGNIYVFGGATAVGNKMQNLTDAYQFDIAARKWTRLPDLPAPTRSLWAVPAENKIVLIGGYTDRYETSVYEYDPGQHIYRRLVSLPHPTADGKFFLTRRTILGAGGETADHVRGRWTIQASFAK
jgi:N-acetylneuraminic acid mutarotase